MLSHLFAAVGIMICRVARLWKDPGGRHQLHCMTNLVTRSQAQVHAQTHARTYKIHSALKFITHTESVRYNPSYFFSTRSSCCGITTPKHTTQLTKVTSQRQGLILSCEKSFSNLTLALRQRYETDRMSIFADEISFRANEWVSQKATNSQVY